MAKEEKLEEVNSLEEIPDFESEAEEAEFWSTHSFGDGLLEKMTPIPEGERPIKLNTDLINRLEALADAKGVARQTLIEQFVAERIYEEEKREGII